jgi:hypothetical protein
MKNLMTGRMGSWNLYGLFDINNFRSKTTNAVSAKRYGEKVVAIY